MLGPRSASFPALGPILLGTVTLVGFLLSPAHEETPAATTITCSSSGKSWEKVCQRQYEMPPL